MTRFARAKGSKASNEKKPEEATSWLEMKEAMLKKVAQKSEFIQESEKSPVKKEIVNTTQSEWASLGDDSPLDFLKSELLRRRKIKENEKQVSETSTKKKKAKSKTKSNNVKLDDSSSLMVQSKTKDTTLLKNENQFPDKLNISDDIKLGKKKKKKKPKSTSNSDSISGDQNLTKKSKKKKKSDSISNAGSVSIDKKSMQKGKKIKSESISSTNLISVEKKVNTRVEKVMPESTSNSSMVLIDGKKIKKEKNNKLNFGQDLGGQNISLGKKSKKRLLPNESVDNSSEVPVKKKKKLNKLNNSGANNEEEKSNIKNKKFDQKKQNNKIKKKSNFELNQKFNKNSNKKFGKNFSDESKFKNRNSKGDHEVIDEVIVNGEKVPIVKFRGFPILQEDAERLEKLNKEMIKEGIPKVKREAALKLERRRAEKALSRLKKAVCFHCRGSGHLLSNCPVLNEKQDTSTGICYKCGSTEHSSLACKVVKGTNFQFAECFICKEQGHIARQCPDNPRGLYPNGGACRECGDVTHLRKDCPQAMSKKMEEVVTAELRDDRNLECLDEEIVNREKKKEQKKVKKHSIKF